MPLAPVIAAALTDPTQVRIKALTVGGLDVLKKPGATGNGYGVLIESVVVSEAGPNGTSALSFTLEDPQAVAVWNDGDAVRFDDLANGRPIFAGYLSTWKQKATPVGGRMWIVECVGSDATLDWAIVPATTIPAGISMAAAIQSLVAQAIYSAGGVPLNATAPSPAVGSQSSLATPIANDANSSVGTAVVIGAGTLRSAIQAVFDHALSNPAGQAWWAMVDAWWDLRVWSDVPGGAITGPSDYAVASATVDSVSAANPDDWNGEVDATGIVRGVYVIGGNAAGTGTVMDGTGKAGRIVTISDSTILTSADRDNLARQYLATRTIATRGTVTFEDKAISVNGNVHPGVSLTLFTGVTPTSVAWRIMGVTRRYTAGGTLETVTFDYGGMRPSLVRLARRFTRGALA